MIKAKVERREGFYGSKEYKLVKGRTVIIDWCNAAKFGEQLKVVGYSLPVNGWCEKVI